jgi:TATA-binding protein-associated factor
MPPKPSRTKSPLEKLVKLLEESKDGDTLRLAARKICDIARQHPRQLPAVFRQILHALFNQTSKARISAGEALGLIAAAIPHHAPEDLAAALHITGDACKALQPDNRLSSLDRFRLDHVREKGRALLVATVSKNALDLLSPKNRTIAISRDLGLAEPPALPGNVPHNCTLPALASPFTSARECEKADDQVRRKRDRHEAEPGSESHVAGSETPGAEAISQTGRDSDDAEDDRIAAGGWPFELIADTLLAALLDTDWRVRHGAAVGLREILKDHARCAAVMAPVCGRLSGWRASGARGPLKLAEFGAGEVREAFAQRQEWLDRAIGLLVSLIVLDDVADYGADQIMAPVRETAAQALALASTALTLNMRLQLLNTLVSLQTSDAWKVHYGAMLGIKYMLATSADDAAALLPVAMPALMAALRDGEDDVQVCWDCCCP